MKKQIVFIHGGTAFSDYEKFLEYLKTRPIDDPLAERPKRWKDSLREELGDEYEVFMPSMPNSQNAKYEEWKIWFERHFEFLHDGVILIGHSQGGYFLAKYLTENKMPVSVHALFLIASPFEPEDFGGEDGGDFVFCASKLKNLEKQVPRIYIYHSKDDPIVPHVHAEKFIQALPTAELKSFDDRGHFLSESFPELLESVKQAKFDSESF